MFDVVAPPGDVGSDVIRVGRVGESRSVNGPRPGIRVKLCARHVERICVGPFMVFCFACVDNIYEPVLPFGPAAEVAVALPETGPLVRTGDGLRGSVKITSRCQSPNIPLRV